MSHRRAATRRPLGMALGLVLLGSCSRPAAQPRASSHPATYASLSPAAEAELERLRAAAQAAPDDYAAHKALGLRLMEHTLSGVLPLQAEAERTLERAFALRDDDEQLLRSLGRFYNMRAVEYDFSKADAQIRVYAALLGDEDPQAMSVSHFVAYGFFMLGRIIQAADQGDRLRALRLVRSLERTLARRTATQPDNVELAALAGNFALFFAGSVPVGRRKRLRRGAAHFEFVKAHWSDMRPGARDPWRCPNTYENFVFELAEAQLALGRTSRAHAIYRELSQVRGQVTRGKELIAAASRHRLEHLPAYTGRLELMPPWPSDVGNCIVCHAYTGQLPTQTLWVAPGLHLDLAATPTEAKPRPVRAPSRDPQPARDDPGTATADPLRRICGACHAPGGEAHHILDLSDPTAVSEARAAILDAIESGAMPPDRPLSASERQALLDVARAIPPRSFLAPSSP
ncbi:MAG: hypothetical protein AAGF11_52230 [Myxococcota bacterium]